MRSHLQVLKFYEWSLTEPSSLGIDIEVGSKNFVRTYLLGERGELADLHNL